MVDALRPLYSSAAEPPPLSSAIAQASEYVLSDPRVRTYVCGIRYPMDAQRFLSVFSAPDNIATLGLNGVTAINVEFDARLQPQADRVAAGLSTYRDFMQDASDLLYYNRTASRPAWRKRDIESAARGIGRIIEEARASAIKINLIGGAAAAAATAWPEDRNVYLIPVKRTEEILRSSAAPARGLIVTQTPEMAYLREHYPFYSIRFNIERRDWREFKQDAGGRAPPAL